MTWVKATRRAPKDTQDGDYIVNCHVCGRDGQEEGRRCGYCGAVVQSLLGEGEPLPEEAVRQLRWKRQHPTIIVKRRRFRILLNHMLAGVVIFILAGVVVAGSGLLNSIEGLASSSSRREAVRAIVDGLIYVAMYAALIGAPMGAVLGWLDWGFVLGGVIGAAVFLACYFLAGFDRAFASVHPALVPLLLPILGFTTGSLISFQARMKRE